MARQASDGYTIRVGYDEDRDVDILMTTFDDGHVTVAFRPGKGDVNVSWSRPVPLVLEAAHLPDADEPWTPVLP